MITFSYMDRLKSLNRNLSRTWIRSTENFRRLKSAQQRAADAAAAVMMITEGEA